MSAGVDDARGMAAVILIVGFGSAMFGRALLGRWLNHLTVYAAGWTISLVLYELKLIDYYPVGEVGWIFIIVAWLVFFSVSAIVAWSVVPPESRSKSYNLRALELAILVMTLAGCVSVVIQLQQILREFQGGFAVILAKANDIYGLRMRGELGGVPYLFFLTFPACALSGAYAAIKGRISPIVAAPFIPQLLTALMSMQRAGIVIAGLTAVFAYHYSKKKNRIRLGKPTVLVAGAGVAVVFGAFLFVSSVRGMFTAFPRQSATLTRISEYAGSFPSQYMYASAPPAALGTYLRHPEVERARWGSYTFAPVYRVLTKLGFRTYVPYYTPFYYTPAEVNQATYLAYIHSDFGPAGIVIVPCMWAAALTFLSIRLRARTHLGELMIHAHLLLAVAFCFSGYIVSFGYWLLSIVISSALGYALEARATARSV